MVLVIQCAGRKRDCAGTLRHRNGSPVMFVANPKRLPHDARYVYAHPDDLSDSGITWRERLLRYNREPGTNPLGLLQAWELYQNSVYSRLVKAYGTGRVYILSAGWGLITADFLTPDYNITFSQAPKGNKRIKSTRFNDLCLLPQDSKDPIVFFGGKSYVPLFCELTRSFNCRKVVFYNSAAPPRASGCELKRFVTNRRTNWQYECADRFMNGEVEI